MSKKLYEGSIAPKERINIKYVPATGDEQAEVELPLNILVVGDLKGGKEDSAIEEREAISINKHNFDSVMQTAGLQLNFSVKNRLQENAEEALPIRLNINALKEFSPDNVARQVPELKKLLDLREALVALKGPLGNIPSFRASLQKLLTDGEMRAQLLKELGIAREEDSAIKE
ncbi:type VI secretion system contractile sheath small subunit [Enterobacter chengduensis]|uniref:type VI secretion system contractile sheath small subunit n=1 Tax=Enterobacter chengduensis TaxID=2494701 RepID=UPI0020054E0B|nr:type VI secretion system contractile sheath small subunit [Enterobacter chengduensis]MCK7428739.1 type VI secretion system contractile sheath small subunit [Enterobacter chengduensis]